MRKFQLVVLLMMVYSSCGFAQEHVVAVDDRNEAIRLTKMAAEQI